MNNNTITHTISLRPVDKFFFGGETHHELDSRRKYFHRSNPYPQQTSLLGMVRHQLLLQKNYIPLGGGNQVAASDLIGGAGFDPASISYGAIAAISPVCWAYKGRAYYRRPFDWITHKGQPLQLSVDWDKKAKSWLGVQKEVPILTYNLDGASQTWIAKNDFCDKLAHDTSSETFNLDKITSDYEQVGIWKDRTGAPKEEGYYKFVYKQMAADWSFAFQVSFFKETPDGQPFEFDTTPRVITMGAEQSPFRLEVLEGLALPASQSAQSGRLQKIVLTSDAYISDEKAFYDLVNLPLCSATPFRFQRWKVREDNFARIPDRSERFHLLTRGSVFYSDQSEKLVELLESQKGFHTIGYNHFLIENI